MAGIARSAIIVGSEVNGFAAERAAVVDERLVLLNSHGDSCLDDDEWKDGRRW
jgi:hypothetical protein